VTIDRKALIATFRLSGAILFPVFLVVFFEIANGISEGFFITRRSANWNLINDSTMFVENIKMGKSVSCIVATNFVPSAGVSSELGQDRGKPDHSSRLSEILDDYDKTVADYDGMSLATRVLSPPSSDLFRICDHASERRLSPETYRPLASIRSASSMAA
jgi:hypothetical protein